MNPQGQPLTTIAQIQNAMAQKRQDIGQRMATLPQTEANLRATLFGGDKTLGSLRDNEASKIKELYNHDQQVASNYQPQAPGFIEDPGAKAKYGSNILAQAGGELADIQKGIANRRDVIGSALEKSMKLLMYGLDAERMEMEGLKDEREFMFKQKQHEDDLATRGSKRDTSIVEANGRRLLIDTQTGEVIKDLGATESSPDLSQYLQILRGMTGAKKKQPAKKSIPEKGGKRPPLSSFEK